VAELDSEPIIKALSGLEGCRVLGSPRFAASSRQKTVLGFTPEVEARANLMEGPRRVEETRIGWQVEVRPELRNNDHSVSFEISPRVNRYEGFVVSPDGFSLPVEGTAGPSQSVHSSHELRTQVEVPLGATLMLAGLTWDEGAPHRLKTGVIRQLPFVGHYVQLKETAGRQTELLVFVRARKP
jgi:type II secretory pathway component GspD/PulD (secretin)